jgi:hypothetical protein
MASNVSRNDPCPCGSNKKYKNCHGRKGLHFSVKTGKRAFLAVIIIAAVAWGGKHYIFNGDDGQSSVSLFPQQTTKRVQPLAPQPPGPVPEGKVWSPEHGHWHDAPVSSNSGEVQYHPKPEGLAPLGKVWSYEHGHWHDTTGAAEKFKPGPQPPGPVPEGKVWSYEHGHWHDLPQGQTASATPKPAPVKDEIKLLPYGNTASEESKNSSEETEPISVRPKGTIIE